MNDNTPPQDRSADRRISEETMLALKHNAVVKTLNGLPMIMAFRVLALTVGKLVHASGKNREERVYNRGQILRGIDAILEAEAQVEHKAHELAGGGKNGHSQFPPDPRVTPQED